MSEPGNNGVEASEIDKSVNNQPHQEEWNILPERPEALTYRGRYDVLDKKIIDLIGLNNFHSEKPIRVLDFGAGVLSFGSPTAHDLIDKIEATNNQAQIEVVDTNIPNDLNPSYSEVKYHHNINKAQGQFDIVKALRVFEHLPKDEINEVSQNLMDKVREGGIYVSTPIMTRYKEVGSGVEHPLPTFIKILQKREGHMIPIAVLPATNVYPKPSGLGGFITEEESSYRQKYETYRKAVMEGKESTDQGFDQEGLTETLTLIGKYGDIRILETDFVSIPTDGYVKNEFHDPAKTVLDQLEQNATKTAENFSDNLKNKSSSISFIRRVFNRK